eukprot:10263559-Alexandrium_andersonii.AAC.1
MGGTSRTSSSTGIAPELQRGNPQRHRRRLGLALRRSGACWSPASRASGRAGAPPPLQGTSFSLPTPSSRASSMPLGRPVLFRAPSSSPCSSAVPPGRAAADPSGRNQCQQCALESTAS